MHSGKLNWIELSWTVRRRNWRPSQVLHNWGILSRIGQSMQYLSLGENRRRPATAVAGSWLSRLENLRGYDGRRRSSQLVAGSVESVHSGKLNWTQQNWTERSSSVQLSSVFRCAFGLRIGHLNWTELNWTELNMNMNMNMNIDPATNCNDSATKLAVVELVAGSSQSGHTLVNRSINHWTKIGDELRRLATRRFLTVKNLRPATAVAGRRSSSPV